MRRRKPVLRAVLIGLGTALAGLTILYLLIFRVFDPQTQEISQVEKNLKIAVPRNSSVIEYSDSTGWFGDGEVDIEVALPLDSDEKEMGVTGQNAWHPLPMPKDLTMLIYGGDEGTTIQYGGLGNDWIKKTKSVQTGAYFFLDRNETDLREKISPLQNRYSQDFTFALYDSSAKIIYFYKYDS
ncbi:hypothetical protein EQM14_06390 [Caproiciproducens sp. NJN-50]|uniref:hypothetical protein n=1 Tax=Acutalibacteraceae TaxID=3082771 RepID=UPI000FFE1AB3|nr:MULTISPECIES: hypothetical protein [Acutalibacteraceae]QAT49431.1 hypothetical protein EQM14_06390 [Caproiciproducens sp. NJN-50]